MRIKTSEKYSAVIIDLKGNVIGGPDSEKFSKLLHDLLDEGKKHVVVNLGSVKFMNSSGLGMLISGFTTMKNGGGSLILANATEKINSLLVITKLITIFENFDSVDEAVKTFEK